MLTCSVARAFVDSLLERDNGGADDETRALPDICWNFVILGQSS